MPEIGVWHRNDLRFRDNKALRKAYEDGSVNPFFIFDPSFYNSEKICDARFEFLHESLEELDSWYNEKGTSIAYKHGNAVSILQELSENLDRIYVNADPTAGYARRRDSKAGNIGNLVFFEDDAIVRNGNSRENWRSNAEEYFSEEIVKEPDNTDSNVLTDAISIQEIENEYQIDSNKNRRHYGGWSRAEDRLEDFVNNISGYTGSISPPAEAEGNTSQLSPYIKFGCISVRQAYKKAMEGASDGRARQMFISRLFWNQHFTQKLQDNPDLRRKAVNPVFRGINRTRHDEKLHRAWCEGRTGFPMVDASMRALKKTGWMNFRMRAMCASFYTYILRCWWKKGADWYYRHLIDADPAINYAQWQMQSGLVGVHPLRIYNPMKQVRENDPDGDFIRKYVPELRDLPSKFLDEPEKTPVNVQDEVGINIGEDYPYPVVDFEKRRMEAREYWSSLDERAKEALKDPEVFKRASLSSDSRDKLQESENKTSGQSEIGDFS